MVNGINVLLIVCSFLFVFCGGRDVAAAAASLATSSSLASASLPSSVLGADGQDSQPDAGVAGLRVDGYVVSGIVVDVPDESAKAAKEKAIMLSYRRGFLALLDEMASRTDLQVDPDRSPNAIGTEISESDLDGLVQDFEIEQEKQSSVRYIGTFQVRFNETAVNRYIHARVGQKEGEGKTVPYGAPASSTLIIPIFQNRGQIHVWDDQNQWFQALNKLPSFDDKSFILPVGDLDDQALFTVPHGDGKAVPSLDSIMDHYRVTRGIVAQLMVSDDTDDVGSLTLFYGAKGMGIIHFETIPLKGSEKNTLLTAAYDLMGQSWHRFLKKGGGGENHSLSASVRFDDAEEWGRIQEKIRAIPFVKRVWVDALRMRQADIRLSYVGTESGLIAALTEAGLHMTGPKNAPVLTLGNPAKNPNPGVVSSVSIPMVIPVTNHPALKNIGYRPD